MPRWIAMFSLVLATTSSLTLTPAAESLAAAGGADLCFGQTPTIVGKPGYTEVVGTEGPDVVVTNGAAKVSTLGGDDLLCVTGAAPIKEAFYQADFFTGGGRDRIDATGGEFPTSTGAQGGYYSLDIWPGPGRDEVLGGPHTTSAGDVITTLVLADDESANAADADIIKTGDGPDRVNAGDDDVVDLGGGNDELWVLYGNRLSGGVFDGGEGQNSIELRTSFGRVDEQHSWKFNNRAGRIARDGEIVARMSNFSEFDVQATGPLKFIGSDGAESFDSSFVPFDPPPRTNWPLLLDMRGGADVVVYRRGGPDSRFDGGDGVDRLWFEADSQPDHGFLDLSTGVLRHGRTDGPQVTTRAVNLENARWAGPADATIRGTDGPNEIISGRHKPGRDMTIHGGRGDDFLRGGLGTDVLIGGPGHDVADGQGGGSDRCKAEVRTHCEL